MDSWMRVLEVRLRSKYGRQELIFGDQWKKGKVDLNIQVTGHKYMSSLKDSCTIKISNLTYNEIVQIVDGKFYDVEVIAGYRNGNQTTFFKGGVLYISNSLDDTKTNTVYILCASELVAKYGQSRINLTLNSGINLYSAISYLLRLSGVKDSNISQEFKRKMLIDSTVIENTSAEWLNKLVESHQTYIVNSDSSTGGSVTLFDISKSYSRLIYLKKENIALIGGYPQLTNDGLRMTVLPQISFKCGDTIKIDNSLISVPTKSQTEVEQNYGYYLDKDGLYTIYEIDFNLTNRNSDFSVNILARSKNLMSNITSG